MDKPIKGELLAQWTREIEAARERLMADWNEYFFGERLNPPDRQ